MILLIVQCAPVEFHVPSLITTENLTPAPSGILRGTMRTKNVSQPVMLPPTLARGWLVPADRDGRQNRYLQSGKALRLSAYPATLPRRA